MGYKTGGGTYEVLPLQKGGGAEQVLVMMRDGGWGGAQQVLR